VWATGVQRGADLADEIIFLGDGAAWIWNLVERNFPHAFQIVDWYHAVEYLTPIAAAVYGVESPAGKDWLEAATTNLWEGQVDQAILACQAFERHAQAAEAARKAITYYSNNARRMDYARFRAAGYQLGSGTIESGCKQIAVVQTPAIS
jgi:transposase